jgi:hypothetical protein
MPAREVRLQLHALIRATGEDVVGATAGLNDNTFHRFGATRRGLDLEVWLEGASNGKTSLSSAADLSQVGRPLSLGGVSESSRSSLHGNIAEVIVVKGNLTNAQLAELDAYFKTKHAL